MHTKTQNTLPNSPTLYARFLTSIFTACEINPRSPKELATIASIEISYTTLPTLNISPPAGAYLIEARVCFKGAQNDVTTPCLRLEYPQCQTF